jgi:hypothetical protein
MRFYCTECHVSDRLYRRGGPCVYCPTGHVQLSLPRPRPFTQPPCFCGRDAGSGQIVAPSRFCPAHKQAESEERTRERELQEAVDRAYGALNGSAYVGGPSEREAFRTALDALGAVVTQEQGAEER